jgi:GLPGLI family protein
MKKILVFLLLTIQTQVFAQTGEGTLVTYEKVSYWSKIYDKLTFLSEEERSRAKTSWGSSDEGDKSRGQLFATSGQSKYVDMDNESDGGYSWRRGEYSIYRDFDKSRKTEIEDFSGKTYIIEDTLIAPAWKVMNKIKEINGYMCMMAVAEDTIKGQKIVAWFANDIPLSAGPERYFGLPGLIMETDVNDGEVIITAIKVEKKAVGEDIKLPKKMKGKKLTSAEYNRMMRKFIDDSIKSRRNPYWAIRY